MGDENYVYTASHHPYYIAGNITKQESREQHPSIIDVLSGAPATANSVLVVVEVYFCH